MSAGVLRHYSYGQRPAHHEGPQEAVHSDTVELSAVSSGHEWVRMEDDATTTLRRGEAIVIPAGVAHSSGTDRSAVRFHVLHLSAASVTPLVHELGAPQLLERGQFSVSTQTSSLFSQLHREHLLGRGVRGHTLLLDALTTQLVVQLARQRSGASSQTTVSGSVRSVDRAMEAMRAAPEQDHSLESLARVAGLSPFHFARTFRSRFGVSPHQQLLTLRLDAAVEQMREGNRSLTEIALDVGFGASSRLTEAFQRKFGVAPSVYRANLTRGRTAS